MRTPGPWKIANYTEHGCAVVESVNLAKKHVPNVGGIDTYVVAWVAEHRHDAKAIAAVPDMIAVLEKIVGAFCDIQGRFNSDAPLYARAARDALKKAGVL